MRHVSKPAFVRSWRLFRTFESVSPAFLAVNFAHLSGCTSCAGALAQSYGS